MSSTLHPLRGGILQGQLLHEGRRDPGQEGHRVGIVSPHPHLWGVGWCVSATPDIGGSPSYAPSPAPPRLTRQFPSSSARRMMVPHFFPGMPLPGWDVSMAGAHMVSWGCPPCTGHPKTYPLEATGLGLLPRGCMVAVPILQGRTLKGHGEDPHPRKSPPPKKRKSPKKPQKQTCPTPRQIPAS